MPPYTPFSSPSSTLLLPFLYTSIFDTVTKAAKLYGDYEISGLVPLRCAQALDTELPCSPTILTAETIPFAPSLFLQNPEQSYFDITDTEFLEEYCTTECRDALDDLRIKVQRECGHDDGYDEITAVEDGDEGEGFGDVGGMMRERPGYVSAGAAWGWDLVCLRDDVDQDGEPTETHFCLAEELSPEGNLPCSKCSLSYQAALAEFPPPMVSNPAALEDGLIKVVDGCEIPRLHQTSWYTGVLYTGTNVWTEEGVVATVGGPGGWLFGTGPVTATADPDAEGLAVRATGGGMTGVLVAWGICFWVGVGLVVGW